MTRDVKQNRCPVHLNHPSMAGHTLCGCIAGPGCRVAQEGQTVTCAACRAVIQWARNNVKIGHEAAP